MATYKIDIPARNRAIDEALGVVCGVDYASGPDRTGLTFLVPGKGIYEVPAKDAERVFGAEIDGAPVRETTRDACCGAPAGERHLETCPRVVEWWSTRCGARPQ